MSYYYGVSGIYAILNAANGKMYVGLTKNIGRRFATHRRNLKRGKHENRHLQFAWNFYGEDNFQFVVLEKCDPDLLSDREQYYIKLFGTMDRENGYNSTSGGESPDEITDEMRQHMSESHVGRQSGPNNGMYGKKRTDESKKKQSDSRKGKYVGEKHPMWGKKLSKEARETISKNHTGLKHPNRKRVSEDGRKNISKGKRESIANRGIKRSNTSSKYVGVYFRKDSGKWRSSVSLGVGKRKINLGTFETEEEAARAYNEAALKYYGPNAKLNVIEEGNSSSNNLGGVSS